MFSEMIWRLNALPSILTAIDFVQDERAVW